MEIVSDATNIDRGTQCEERKYIVTAEGKICLVRPWKSWQAEHALFCHYLNHHNLVLFQLSIAGAKCCFFLILILFLSWVFEEIALHLKHCCSRIMFLHQLSPNDDELVTLVICLVTKLPWPFQNLVL